MFSLSFTVMLVDVSSRQAHIAAIQLLLDELERHIAAKNEPFFGGLSLRYTVSLAENY